MAVALEHAGWFANRVGVPYPIVLVMAGIGMGSVYSWEREIDLAGARLARDGGS